MKFLGDLLLTSWYLPLLPASTFFIQSLVSLQWRHKKHDGVSIHLRLDCLFDRLSRHISKKTSKLPVTGLCGGIHRWPVDSPHKGRVTRKMFPFDDGIMCTRFMRIQVLFKEMILSLKWNNMIIWDQYFAHAMTARAYRNPRNPWELRVWRFIYPWWRHQMETFSALLALCAGNSPVTGEFPAQRPVTRSFDVFFLICAWIKYWVNNGEAGDLRRHCPHYDVIVMLRVSHNNCMVIFDHDGCHMRCAWIPP